MRYIVIDTNCLVQIIPSRSPYRQIWDSILCGKITICVSSEILDEYFEILTQLTSLEVATNIIQAITNSPFTKFIDPHFHFNIITTDPDDNKFVDCAIVAQADYIVSNDKHFEEVKKCDFPKVNVVRLDEFLILQ